MTEQQQALIQLFEPYSFPNGLFIEFPDEKTWLVSYHGKEDSGRIDMPFEDILHAVNKVAEL